MTATFGQLLRQYRTAAGISQEHLAGLARISVESVGALERGTRRAPYRETVSALAQALALDEEQRAAFERAAEHGRARPGRIAGVAAAAPKRTLPRRFTSFIEREDDVEAITALLERSRLVTITGSGGVGKTRIAVELAERLPAGRWDAIQFADLSELTDGSLVITAIAPDLERSVAGSAPTLDALISVLEATRTLIVLDTCEHHIAHVARIVSKVLSACEHVSFLATSRERLGVYGEAVYRLPSLPLPDVLPATLDSARRYAGVELFLQRLAAVDNSFVIADDSIASIVDICRQLDGIPLAIELAAARVPSLGLRGLAGMLRQGRDPTQGERDLPARQQTMFATITWSYNLLSDQERLFFQRLAPFAGGFTLAAAESVCASDGVEASSIAILLASLVEKSLVQPLFLEGSVRYRLMDSVRSFVRERLAESGQREVLARRHATWLAELGDWAHAGRSTYLDHQVSLQVDPELDNARTAIAWALQSSVKSDVVLAGRIVGGLRTIWVVSCKRNELRTLLEPLLRVLDEGEHPELVARLLKAATQVVERSDVSAYADRLLPILERLGDHASRASIFAYVAINLCCDGRMTEGRKKMEHAIVAFAASGRQGTPDHAAFLNVQRFYFQLEGQYSTALATLDEAEAIARECGDDRALILRIARASVLIAMRETDAAIRLMEALLRETPRGAEDDLFIFEAYAFLGVCHVMRGDIDLGRAAARDGFLLGEKQWPYRMINVLRLVAIIAATDNDAPFAATCVAALDHLFRWELLGVTEKYIRDLAIAAVAEKLTPQEVERYSARGRRLTTEQLNAATRKYIDENWA